MDNQDGTRSVRYADGRVEPLGADGERGLGVSSNSLVLPLVVVDTAFG